MPLTPVFDAASNAPAACAPLGGLLFVALAFALLRLISRVRKAPVRGRSAGARAALGLVVVVGALAASQAAEQLYLRFLDPLHAALARARVVEGPVSGLVTEGAPGEAHERFVVGGRAFQYGDNDAGQGYHLTRARGGRVREGVVARIHFVEAEGGPLILRLELGP